MTGPHRIWGHCCSPGGREKGAFFLLFKRCMVCVVFSIAICAISGANSCCERQDAPRAPMESENSISWIRLLQADHGPRSCAFVTDVRLTNEGNIAICGYEMAALKGSLILGDRTNESTDCARSFVCMINTKGEVLWTRRFGGLDPSLTLSTDIPMTVGADSNGNLYVAGCFDRLVDFDPSDAGYWDSPATTGTLSSYLLKLGQNGDFQWVITVSGTDTAWPAPRILADVNAQGDIYLLSSTSGITLRSSLGWETLINGNQRSLSKFSTEGHAIWTVTWGGDKAGFIGTTCGNNGELYITGFYEGDFDFDPGKQDVIPRCNGQHNGFLMRIGSDGTFDWLKTWGAGSAGGQAVAVSEQNSVYVAGWIRKSSAFDRAINPPQGPYPCDVHLQSYGADGSLLWERSWGEFATLQHPELSCASGNIFLYGWFKGRPDVGPGTELQLRKLTGYEKSFYLWGFDDKGDTLALRTWEPVPGVSQATGVDVDDSGNIYLTGGGVWKSFVMKLDSAKLRDDKNQ